MIYTMGFDDTIFDGLCEITKEILQYYRTKNELVEDEEFIHFLAVGLRAVSGGSRGRESPARECEALTFEGGFSAFPDEGLTAPPCWLTADRAARDEYFSKVDWEEKAREFILQM